MCSPAPGHLEQGGGIDWSRVTASSILGLDREGAVLEGRGEPELSGACIHLGVRRARPGARVIMVGTARVLVLSLWWKVS